MERTHRRLMSSAKVKYRICFNPCCDGTDSSTPEVFRGKPKYRIVSILVVMERTHRRRRPRSRTQWWNVSILVVMERTHRPLTLTKKMYDLPLKCFNPCCDGTDSSTSRKDQCRFRGHVSILVVMERTHRQERPGVRVSWFQSLL